MNPRYKTEATDPSVRFGRTLRLRNGDVYWMEVQRFDALRAELADRLARLRSEDPSGGEQLSALGWLINQVCQQTVVLDAPVLRVILDLLYSPLPDVPSSATQLLRHLVKYPSKMGLILVKLRMFDVWPDPPPSFIADLMRSSADCRQLLLAGGVLDRIRRGHFSAGDFAELSGAAVLDQAPSDLFCELFLRNVRNISEADPRDLRELTIAFQCFVTADDAFIQMFVENNVLQALLERSGDDLDCELEMIYLLARLATHSPETAECLVAGGVCNWIRQRLASQGRTKHFSKMISLLADIVFFVPTSCEDPGDVGELAASYFDRGSVKLKAAVIRLLIALINVVADADLPAVVEQAPIVMASPGLVPPDDAQFYLRAVHRVLEGLRGDEIAALVEEGGDLFGWLDDCVKEKGKNAEHADVILGMLLPDRESCL
jgi:hypothetical protein